MQEETSKTENTDNKFILALKQFRTWSINVLGISGLFLIAYSLIAVYTGSRWAILDNIADALAKYATLIGTLLIAISIYFPINTRTPDPFSVYFSAPIITISIIVAIAGTLFWSINLPLHLVNGFALLAISGALFRLVSR